MKTKDKDKKNFDPKTAAKGATLAAMVAALGISLGTEVKSVYAQGNDLNSNSKLKMEGALAIKGEIGDTQEWKVDGSQQVKLTQSASGKIVSISGNRVTLLDANNKSFSCYYDVNGLVAGVIPFNVVVTNSFNSVSATYNILRVGTLTYYSIQQPTFDFGSIYNDWIMVSQPLLVNNTGNYRFFGEDVRLASVACNNINFNLSSVYFGPNANRASADSFEYDFYDLIVDSGETRNFYMFLYNPNRITPTNCRAKMNIGLLSEVD